MTHHPFNSLAARGAQATLHGFSDPAALLDEGALPLVRGHGIFVEDEAGRRYLDAMAGLWCASLGFSGALIARLAEAARQQMAALPFEHTFYGRSNPAVVDLCERLKTIAPMPTARVFLACSGSEANDTAAKLAWAWHAARGEPGRRLILARDRAYHGSTVFAAGLTGLPTLHEAFGLPQPDSVVRLRTPWLRHEAQDGEDEHAFVDRLVVELEEAIVAAGPGRVAAFIAEPIMGAGGVIIPPAGYFAAIQPVLRRHGILAIADEVIGGFGRTGTTWSCQGLGFLPDIVTCAKALSAAVMPISAVLIGERIWPEIEAHFARLGVFGHGHTYSGHPVAAAVAVETLKIYDEMDAPARCKALGDHLLAGLRARFDGHPFIGEIRGRGLLAALTLEADPDRRRPFPKTARANVRVAEAALAEGLMVRSAGAWNVALSPPYTITEGEIDEALDRLARALDVTTPALAEAAVAA